MHQFTLNKEIHEEISLDYNEGNLVPIYGIQIIINTQKASYAIFKRLQLCI